MQGEQQQKLDVFANQALIHCLGIRDAVAMLVSEENEEPVTFDRDSDTGKYIVIFDPLDGSSNIDVNVSVGTIFSIFRRPPAMKPARRGSPAWLEAGGGGIRGLRIVHDVRLHRGPRRVRFHARSRGWRIRAEPREHAHAQPGQLLFRQ